MNNSFQKSLDIISRPSPTPQLVIDLKQIRTYIINKYGVQLKLQLMKEEYF